MAEQWWEGRRYDRDRHQADEQRRDWDDRGRGNVRWEQERSWSTQPRYGQREQYENETYGQGRDMGRERDWRRNDQRWRTGASDDAEAWGRRDAYGWGGPGLTSGSNFERGGRERDWGRERDMDRSMRRGHEGDRGWWDKTSDEVRSWFGDDDAERRRQQDHRGRGPKGYVRADSRITEDVNDRLTDDPQLDATDIEVSVHDREVTLKGEVDSRYAKRHAEELAEHVSGVRNVINSLRVRERSYNQAQYGAGGTTSQAGGATGQAGAGVEAVRATTDGRA